MRRLAAAGLLFFVSACAVIAGRAKQDEVEAEREQQAAAAAKESEHELPGDVPDLDVHPEGFGDSAAASIGNAVAEGIAIVTIAALITSIVHLFRHRLPLLGFLTSVMAILLAALAFLKAWA